MDKTYMMDHSKRCLDWQSIVEKLKNMAFSEPGVLEADEMSFSDDPSVVRNKLGECREMKQILEESQPPDVEIWDISRELARCQKKDSYLFADEIIKVAKSLKGSRMMKEYILDFKDRVQLIIQIAEGISGFRSLENKAFQSIDEDQKITDNASKELKNIRQDIRRLKSSIEKRLKNVLNNPDNSHLIQDNIVTVRENRYVIPIKKDHKGKLKGIVLDTSNSGETLFIEPESVVEDNNLFIGRLRAEKDEEIRVLKRLTEEIRTHLPEINESLKLLGKLDNLYCRGKMAIEMGGIQPEINDRGVYKLYHARHPLLKGEVTPVNLLLGEDYDVLVITGPNTGGKTVALKTLGLLVMMACHGLLIPCQEGSELSTCDEIFIDSGDEQSIEQNLSTFSGHVKRIIEILGNATEKSLVLMDELGAGTDPEEGSSLGIAILDELRGLGCRSMVTTHYARLKNYPLVFDRVENGACEFDLETLMPRYHLVYGVSGKSNAIDIARRLGLGEKIVKQAEEIIQSNIRPEDRLIDSVHEEKERSAILTQRYEEKLKELSRKESELKIREDIVQKQQRELRKKELAGEREYLSETRRNINKLFAEAKASTLDKDKIKTALDEVDRVKEETEREIEDLESAKPVLDRDHVWEVGEMAYLESIGKSGKVFEVTKSSVTVLIGNIKIKTDPADLRLPPGKSEKYDRERDEGSVSYVNVDSSAPQELQIRGMRGEEAVRETEIYIERLYSSGREKGRIIHGKGSGILRSLIENVLKDHPHVKSYELARPEMGGYGVTEVFLK